MGRKDEGAMIMEHTDADKTRAAERYLLGEMSAVERDDFEEHFFSCNECAEAVRAGAAFADNARAVFREQPHLGRAKRGARAERPAPWWRRWNAPVLAPAFAALLFLCVAGYERVVISRLHGQLGQATAVQPLPVFGLKPVFRSPGEQVIAVPPDASWFSLRFDAPEDATQLVCEIRDESGVARPAIHVTASRSGDAHILLGRSQFPPGGYKLTVRREGGGPAESREYTFQLVYP